MRNFCGKYKGKKFSSSHFVSHTHFHQTDGSSQWCDTMAGPTTTLLPLNFLSSSYTSGPDMFIKFHDKGTQLLQETYSIKGQRQPARPDLCYSLFLWVKLVLVDSSLFLLSSTLHPSSLSECLPRELSNSR